MSPKYLFIYLFIYGFCVFFDVLTKEYLVIHVSDINMIAYNLESNQTTAWTEAADCPGGDEGRVWRLGWARAVWSCGEI